MNTPNHHENHGILIEDTFAEGTLGQNPLLDFDYSGNNVSLGDTLSIPIVLGSADLPINEFHGITFTINFDEDFVGYNSFSYVDGWLGENETEIKVIQTIDSIDLRRNITITRKNLANVSGYGIIGYLEIVIEGDVPNKQGDTEIASISNVKLVNNRLEEELVTLDVLSVYLKSKYEALTIYPNPPQNGYLYINGADDFPQMEFELYDALGRVYPLIYKENHAIELPELANGIYFIRIKGESGSSRKTFKLMITNSE